MEWCASPLEVYGLKWRKGKGKAVVAVAHEMIRIVYFMLKRNEPYRGENVELTVKKLKRMESRASIGLRT